jgi:hypothetical protein
MGFLLEGAYAIAVLTLLTRSALQLRQGSGFGTPIVTLDRSPMIGQPLQVNLSIPTRFTGTASFHAGLKCVAKDTRLFNLSEADPNTVLVDQTILSVPSQLVMKQGAMTKIINLIIPPDRPPSTPIDSAEKTHVIWSLVLTAEGNGGRKTETEYVLSVLSPAT